MSSYELSRPPFLLSGLAQCFHSFALKHQQNMTGEKTSRRRPLLIHSSPRYFSWMFWPRQFLPPSRHPLLPSITSSKKRPIGYADLTRLTTFFLHNACARDFTQLLSSLAWLTMNDPLPRRPKCNASVRVSRQRSRWGHKDAFSKLASSAKCSPVIRPHWTRPPS